MGSRVRSKGTHLNNRLRYALWVQIPPHAHCLLSSVGLERVAFNLVVVGSNPTAVNVGY